MHVTVGRLELDVARGVTARDVADFARARGEPIDDAPWCGSVRLNPEHPAGASPFVHAARLSAVPGPDAHPRLGAHLAVVAGPDSGAVASLAGPVEVGRGDTATLVVDDPSLSARHFRIDAGRVRDLGSVNGTRVGAHRVRVSRVLSRRKVRPGDIVTAGDTTVEVRPRPQEDAESRSRWGRSGILASAGGAVSMAAMGLVSGQWQFAAVALVVPTAMGVRALTASRHPQPTLLLDPSASGQALDLSSGPVAVVGPRSLVRAVVLAMGRPDTDAEYWEPWMAWLPHRAPHDLAWVSQGAVPSWATTVVRALGREMELVTAGVVTRGPVALVSAATAEASARRLAAAADGDALPARAWWGDLAAPPSGSVGIRLGLRAGGTAHVDLATDGPHLLVAGTTGSGKSEALRTLVASLAYDYPPSAVTFALIDFKGGAGLSALADLPHVCSVLTDLEPHLAKRALLALAAELVARKRALAAAGGTSYDDWPQPRPPRLLVVVDEFQEISGTYREFVPELARLAAQGRSLGIHLVLATQRPAGAVSAEIRANISTTIALRTSSADESRDLIGTAEASELSAHVPGRAIVVRGNTRERIQVALPVLAATAPVRLIGEAERPLPSLVDAAIRRHAGPTAPPLWLPELPRRIPPMPASGTFVLGLADMPRERRREPCEWDPAGGPLVVVGPPRSGRTTALGAMCALARHAGFTPVWLPADGRLALRTLAMLDSVAKPLLAIDNAERALAAASTAAPEAAELMAAAVARHGVALVAPPGWSSHRLVAGGTTVVMAGLGAAESAAWNVPADLRALAPIPGRAAVGARSGWREVQLALAGPGSVAQLVRPLPPRTPPNLPTAALGVGGDAASPVTMRQGESVAVIGPPGGERDAVARRVHYATGVTPSVAESVFSLPAAAGHAATVVVRPSARSVREVLRDAPAGLVEPVHVPMRAVLVRDGTAIAVQVAQVDGGLLDRSAAAPPTNAKTMAITPASGAIVSA